MAGGGGGSGRIYLPYHHRHGALRLGLPLSASRLSIFYFSNTGQALSGLHVALG